MKYDLHIFWFGLTIQQNMNVQASADTLSGEVSDMSEMDHESLYCRSWRRMMSDIEEEKSVRYVSDIL